MGEAIVTGQQIDSCLTDAGVAFGAHILIGDEKYRLFTEQDVTTRLAPAVGNVFFRLNWSYKAEKRDCDDFARFASAWAQFLSGENPGDLPVAFGECWSAALSHAFCIAFHLNAAGALYAACYEPQPDVRRFYLNRMVFLEEDFRGIYAVIL